MLQIQVVLQIMGKLLKYIKDPYSILVSVFNRLHPWNWIRSDEKYLKILFLVTFRKKLDLKNPQTFSEKLQWLKLYNRKPEYTMMVDKYAVKEYVSKKIGKEYVIPTIGVWDHVEDIDWDSLPNQFVLKCTHDSGGLVICRNKETLDKKEVMSKLKRCLEQDYFILWREWPYKNVQKRIIAEKYIEPDSKTNDLPDYKFFCFNGQPKYCQVISGRNSEMKIDFFDKEWQHQPFHEPYNYSFADIEPSKPKQFEKMWAAAAILAEGIPFSRIDFYEVGDTVYFGEITFFPTTGLGGFDPKEWDMIFGKMIQLPD